MEAPKRATSVSELFEKIRKFRELFVCPKGEVVKRTSRIPGKDKISCKCGALAVDWKD